MQYNDFSAGFVIAFLLFWYVCQSLAYFKFFQKAGIDGWKGFVPLYNYYIHLQIIGRPNWWFLLFFIPVVNFFVALTIHLDLMKSFGRYSYVDQSLGVVFAPIYMLYIAFSPTKYIGKATSMPKEKKSISKEWFEAIVFAVFAATFIRWIFMEAYVIPTPSMENTLLVGDFLFVSKLEYGPRTPKTPLQIPLTHAKIWGTEIPSYISSIQLPQFRLPSLSKVERGDVVVFNYPPEMEHPKDLRTHYIKRCVGISGDTLEVMNGQVWVNGQEQTNPTKMQMRYFVKANQDIRERVFLNIGIWEFYPAAGQGYIVFTTPEKAEELRKLPFVSEVAMDLSPKNRVENRIFPNSSLFEWNADHFGEIVIPKRGMTLSLNDSILAMYKSTILNYEDIENAKVENGKLLIDNEEQTTYTFKKDYFFMMGDNRHNSEDSRYWGFVSEDFIVGEASFIWMSFDNKANLFSKIRWNRIFKPIK